MFESIRRNGGLIPDHVSYEGADCCGAEGKGAEMDFLRLFFGRRRLDLRVDGKDDVWSSNFVPLWHVEVTETEENESNDPRDMLIDEEARLWS